MAVINGKTTAIQHAVLQAVWAGLGNTDTGTPEEFSRWTYKSVQFGGTFGGATVVLEGSDDGTTYFTLKDVSGNSLSATSAARFDFVDVPQFLRPRTSGGSGTSATVWVTGRSLGH